MADAIFAAVLGVLISAAALGIPQWVRMRHQRSDDDTQAYLQQTGLTAQDIAQGNAVMRERQQSGHLGRAGTRPMRSSAPAPSAPPHDPIAVFAARILRRRLIVRARSRCTTGGGESISAARLLMPEQTGWGKARAAGSSPEIGGHPATGHLYRRFRRRPTAERRAECSQ